MPDLPSFEARLAAAYERYLDAAPIGVDARAMAAFVARPRAVRPRGLRGLLAPGAARRFWVPLVMLLAVVTLASAMLVGSNLWEVVTPPIATTSPRPGPTDVPAPTLIAQYEGAFAPVGAWNTGRGPESLVQLLDGRVLGLGNSYPERRPQTLWDPNTLAFSSTGLLAEKRRGAIAVRLQDGRILVIGGNHTEPDSSGVGIATYSTAEIYDPRLGTFTPAGPMVGEGWTPSAVVLADGRVLVTDGISVDNALAEDSLLATAEVYDPATNLFAVTGSMSVKRGPHPSVRLGDGRVLVTGGTFPESGVAETYDPRTGQFSIVGPLPAVGAHPDGGQYWPEVAGVLVPLQDGRALVAGRRCQEIQTILPGGHGEGWYPTVASIFDPTTDTFTAIDPMPHCVEQAYGLPNGEVLLTSFWNEGDTSENAPSVNWAGLYDPATGTVREAGTPPGGRYMSGVVLSDGRVLFVTQGPEPVAELFR